MSDIQFPVPVRPHPNSTGERVVANSWDALRCLRYQWLEGARGRTYRAAYRRDVLDGWRQPHEARRAFVTAAHPAGLLADIAFGPRPNNARTKPGHRHTVLFFADQGRQRHAIDTKRASLHELS